MNNEKPLELTGGQNWSLVCIIIEVVLEGICIGLYCVVLYRLRSRHRLYKAMERRNKARFEQNALPNALPLKAPHNSAVDPSQRTAVDMVYPTVPVPAAYKDAKQPCTFF